MPHLRGQMADDVAHLTRNGDVEIEAARELANEWLQARLEQLRAAMAERSLVVQQWHGRGKRRKSNICVKNLYRLSAHSQVWSVQYQVHSYCTQV